MVHSEVYMTRALELASLGLGATSPNPLVGCVIVHDNKIIGEGYHQIFGGPHAEVNAVGMVKDTSLLSSATMYVTLEPCNHHGKTPPCTDLIIKHAIPRVVICSVDPNPIVSGKGIQRLKEAGVEVSVGMLSKVGDEVNKRFFTYFTKKRPYIILKWAQTADKFIAKENFESKWISNTLSRKLVHKWRSEEDAILVGYNTALHDNPQLNVREWIGRNPTRIVIDKNNSLPNRLHLFDKTQTTIVLKSVHEMIDLKNIQSVIIEGGSHTIQQCINLNLWDEARVFTALHFFNKGISAPQLPITPATSENIDGDQLDWYFNRS